MKLTEQVCSVELATQLKELGVRQDSEFFWGPIGLEEHSEIGLWFRFPGQCEEDRWVRYSPNYLYGAHIDEKQMTKMVSAFTVAELGEMMTPEGAWRIFPFWQGNNKWWAVEAKSIEEKQNHNFIDTTEANARALTIIRLIKSKEIGLMQAPEDVVLLDLLKKVMALDNRVGTPTDMQYAVRALIKDAFNKKRGIV